MTHQNMEIVRRAVEEVWNRGNFAVVDELAARDVIAHGLSPNDGIHGPEGIKQFYEMLRAAFLDIRFTIDGQIADGDKVVTRWTAQATHHDPFQGVPPTGKQVRVMGVDIGRIVDGKVVECWPIVDELGLMRQLGVVPTRE